LEADIRKQNSVKAMDAVRQSDGIKVLFKRAQTTHRDLPIQTTLTALPDTAPYTAALLDAILLPNTDEEILLAMPLLHGLGYPSFETVYELMDCVLQLTQVRHLPSLIYRKKSHLLTRA
jgi:hypothetical protein